MPSKFYKDISEDERKDWRQHSTTVLALEMLRDFQAQAAAAVLDRVGESGEKLNHKIGVHFGIQEAITLLEKE